MRTCIVESGLRDPSGSFMCATVPGRMSSVPRRLPCRSLTSDARATWSPEDSAVNVPRDLVERDEHHVGGPGHLAPLREDAALDLEAGRVAVAHHQEPAGIHHEIELAVGASEGAAELRMAQDVDGDAGSGFPSGLVTFPRSQPILSLSIVPSLTPSWMGRSPR